MLDHDGLRSENRLSELLFAVASGGHDLPYSVVDLFDVKAYFLVTGEAGVAEGRDGLGVQVKRLMKDVRVSSESDLLSVSDSVVRSTIVVDDLLD